LHRAPPHTARLAFESPPAAHTLEDGIMALDNRARLIALALALCCSVAAAAQTADVKVVGVWKGTMETQMGPAENVITIESAAPLAGTVTVAEYDCKIEKGKLDGEKISFEITIQYGTVAYAGTVSGDEMRLNVTGTTGSKMTLVAKRQK
jgi:hypothetical protein